MPRLNADQILSYVRKAGVRDDMTTWSGENSAQVAIAVALAESGGNTDAHNTNGEDSRGLWQINVPYHPQWALTNLYDPFTNARAMFQISDGGRSWGAWTTYTGGAYRSHLSEAGDALFREAGGGTGGAAIGPIPIVPGIDAGDIPIVGPIFDAVDNVGDFLLWITDPDNWKVLGMILAGALLMVGGLAYLAIATVKKPQVVEIAAPVVSGTQRVASAVGASGVPTV